MSSLLNDVCPSTVKYAYSVGKLLFGERFDDRSKRSERFLRLPKRMNALVHSSFQGLAFRTESVEPMPQSKLAKFSLISAFEQRWIVNFEYVQHEHSLISDSLVVYSMYHSSMFFVCVNYPKFYKILKIWEDALTKFNISFLT